MLPVIPSSSSSVVWVRVGGGSKGCPSLKVITFTLKVIRERDALNGVEQEFTRTSENLNWQHRNGQ